ncbi:hypothetical protein [Sulfurimonas sp. CS5]|uniref:hypothetical protein n=1 Tax=Sulfurimonas sp. CS5 TaxID=3391145 RepID=UPI0039E8EDD8
MIKFINREQLYKQVWSKPFTKLAPKHNISATDLRKLCIKFLIQIPKMGHWQKIAFGHIIETPPLANYNSFTLLTKKQKTVLKVANNISSIKAKKPIIRAPKQHRITVKQTLSSPHSIIAKTRDRLKSGKPDEYGMIHSGDDCVDIRISIANYKEVLRVLDSLFKWFEKKGYEIDVSGRYGTYIKIDEEEIQIAVEEKSTVTKTTLVNNGYWSRTEREYSPSGKVSLLIKSYAGSTRKTWSAGKLHTLEELLPSYIDGIFDFATAKKENRIRQEKEEKERLEAHILKKYNLHCTELERNMIEQLDKQAKDWNFTMQLQSYISAVEDNAKSQNETIPIDTLKWLKWAKQHLNKVNPLKGSLPTYTKAEELLSIEDIIHIENKYRF